MTRTICLIAAAVLGLIMPLNIAAAREDSSLLAALSARWWQWALSIPSDRNPQSDPSGQYCMVGQRGSVWFLAGTFNGDAATRACSVPEGKTFFFPIANAINFNTPNVCGQDGSNLTVDYMRSLSKATIDGASNLILQVDGRPADKLIQRVKSQVFELALPEENMFDKPCADAGLGNVPAGIYSPAVDDGYYVALGSLDRGIHTIHFQAAAGPNGSNEDVTYTLTVVPVLTK